MPLSRSGTTLAELIVVLVLGSVVAGMFARSVVGQRRTERAVSGVSAAAVAADDAVQVVAAALARVSVQDSLTVRGDTALEWLATIGAALACAAGGDTVVVPDSGLAAWWESPPDSSDAADMADASGVWLSSEVVSVRARASGGACAGPQRTIRLRTPINAGVTPFVRVARRLRVMLYRGGDGLWWLGERTCSYRAPIECVAAQPIAGPLSPPPAGLRFTVAQMGGNRSVSVTATAGRVARSRVVLLRP
jgi:type II secretory pathway pseudopilin PulG